MAKTMKALDIKAYTEMKYIEGRLVDVGDVFLRVNYGGIEGFTVEDAQFGENKHGRRTVEIYGVLGEKVVVDPKKIITVVRTTVKVVD